METSEVNSDSHEAALVAALNRRVGTNLRPAAGGASILFLLLVFAHPFALPPEIAGIMVPVAAISSILLALLWLRLRSWSVPEHLTHPVAGLVVAVLIANSVIHLHLTLQPWQTTNLILLTLGTVILFNSYRWFVLSAGICSLGWGLEMSRSGGDDELWMHFGFALFTAVLLSASLLVMRIRGLREFESLRLGLEDEVARQVAELKEKNRVLSATERSLRRQASRLAALNRIGHAVNTNLSLEGVVNTCVTETMAELYPDVVLLFLRDGDALVLRKYAAAEEGYFEAESAALHKVGQCLCGLAASRGEPVYSVDIDHDPRCTQEECREAGIESFAALPLLFEGKVLGVLSVGSRKPRDFEDELEFFDVLSTTVSVGMRNGILYEKTQRQAEQLAESVEELRRAEASQKRLLAQLIQAQRMESIATLSAGIAHDFNNILSAIVGYAELSLAEIDPETPLGSDLREILGCTARAADLVKRILAFSRPKEEDLKAVHLAPLLKESLRFLRASLPSTIQIRESITTDSPVFADATQLHQLILNLATNAGHAMHQTGGTLDVELCDVELEAEFVAEHPGTAPGQYICLTVRDTGHGIEPELLKRIFEPYFTTKEAGEGTGLGLSVVQGIVTASRGIITVSSEPGQGTSFQVYLPAGDGTTVVEAKADEREPPRGAERILLVEDEPLIRNAAASLLRRLGYTVTECRDGIEARRIFERSPATVDLVITDLTMPGMRGTRLAKELRRIRPDLPLILCTGLGFATVEELESHPEVDAILSKPVRTWEWATTIRQVLDQ